MINRVGGSPDAAGSAAPEAEGHLSGAESMSPAGARVGSTGFREMIEAPGSEVSLERLVAAIQRSYGPETCSPDDLPEWTEDNPSRGHCAMAAMVVDDAFGGEGNLRCTQVFSRQTGEPIGGHWFNALRNQKVDPTGGQFFSHEWVDYDGAKSFSRDVLLSIDPYAQQYELFKPKVATHYRNLR